MTAEKCKENLCHNCLTEPSTVDLSVYYPLEDVYLTMRFCERCFDEIFFYTIGRRPKYGE